VKNCGVRFSRAAAVVLSIAALAATAVTVVGAGSAQADVCASAGRRISVSGCANIADAVAPPAYYAPLPQDPPPHRT
jgi:hypothetical protein